MCRNTTLVRAWISVVLCAFIGGCGGLGKFVETTVTQAARGPADSSGLAVFGPGELATRENPRPAAAKSSSDFAVLGVDFNTKEIDQTVQNQLQITTVPEDATAFRVEVRLTDATAVKTLYYQLLWPSAQYELVSVRPGEFFKNDALLGYHFRDPGVLDVAQVVTNFDSKPGYSGTGIVASYLFEPGDGSRQTSVAVNNYGDDTLDTNDEYVPMYDTGASGINRAKTFDGVGIETGTDNSQDGTMFQTVSLPAEHSDVPDVYFDPRTFMFNIITYQPGDYDFNSETNIADITPIGRFFNGHFDNPSSGAYPFMDPDHDDVDTPTKELQHFNANKATTSYYFLRWLDGDFDHIISAQATPLPDDMVPILSYANDDTTHFGEYVMGYYLFVSTDDDLGGTKPGLPVSGERAVALGASSYYNFTGSISGISFVSQYAGSGAYNYTYSDSSGFVKYRYAPYRADTQAEGFWPTEYAGYLNPDVLEVWSSSPESTNGVWDEPGSAHYLYVGTLGKTDTGGADLGVLTPIGEWDTDEWIVEDLSEADAPLADTSRWSDHDWPKQLPISSGVQSLDFSALRKEFDYGGSSFLTVTRPDTYADKLTEYAWDGVQGGGYNFSEIGGTLTIEVTFPRAFDVSGIDEYEVFLTTAANHAAGPEDDSFFEDDDDLDPKTGVLIETSPTHGTVSFDSGLAYSTAYKLMVRPKDIKGNFYDPDEEDDLTVGFTTPPDDPDLTPPEFDGLLAVAADQSNTGQVNVQYDTGVFDPDTPDLASYPVDLYIAYDLASNHANFAAFVADFNVGVAPVLLTNNTEPQPDDVKDSLGDGVDGLHSVTGLSTSGDWFFMMRARDDAGNWDTHTPTEMRVRPLGNIPPTFVGVVNARENGSGKVRVYFDDATDPSTGVKYQIAYALRSLYTPDANGDYPGFWADYNSGSVNVTKTSWIDEAHVSIGGPEFGYDNFYDLTGLTNEVVYLFAVRSQDYGSPNENDLNTALRGCRPTIYSFVPLDQGSNNSDFSGHWLDAATIEVTSSLSRIGVSYLTSSGFEDVSFNGSSHFAAELRLAEISYASGAMTVSTPQTVIAYNGTTAAGPGIGETSVAYMGAATAPGIAYLAVGDNAIGDINPDGTIQSGTGTPGLNEPSGPKMGGRAASHHSGQYFGVWYSQYRTSAWWHDSVDWTTGGISDQGGQGAFNGLEAHQWQNPNGTTYWGPFVSYSTGDRLSFDLTRVRFLSVEGQTSGGAPVYHWRPYCTVGLNTKHPLNAAVQRLTYTLGGDMIGEPHAKSTDIFMSDYPGTDTFFTTAHTMMYDHTDSVFGAVHQSATRVTGTPWGYRTTASELLWTPMPSGPWYITPSANDSTGDLEDETILTTKAESWADGYGCVLLMTDGAYYIDEGSTAFEPIETWTPTLSWGSTPLPSYSIGLAFDETGDPGVVYPAPLNGEWVLKVAEQSGGSWSVSEIVYDDDDPYVTQGRGGRHGINSGATSVYAYPYCKIVYLHDDKWMVLYQDGHYIPFTSESNAPNRQELMMVREP